MSKREKRVVPATTGQREEVDVVVGTERREENGNQHKCVSFFFFVFLIRKSNFGSPKIGIPKLPLVWYPYIYISLKKLPSALRKSFKKFVPINRINCTVYSTLSYSSDLLCKTKRENNRKAIKEEFWERERERDIPAGPEASPAWSGWAAQRRC